MNAEPITGRSVEPERASLLLELSNRIASLQTLDEQLTELMSIITSVTGSERSSLFLNDRQSGELYSRIALGNSTREIRILNTDGVAGAVFQSGAGVVINDAYEDKRFDRSIDERTGFITRSILCAPIRTLKGEIMGVTQALNRTRGQFTTADLELLEAINRQASIFLQSSLFRETMERSRERESEFLDVVSEVSSEIQLGPLLQKIMETVTRMLNAERSTLFLNDEKTQQLYTEIGQGLGAAKLSLPNTAGIAGAVFTTNKSINIPHAYADLRFNPEFDRKTGFFTRSILCVPVVNKHGKVIGVTQVLNRRGGPFSQEDEARLRAFTAQISIGLENAKLFDDVQNIKNYNESMLQSMSNGVVTFGTDGCIVTANAAALRLMRTSLDELSGKPVAEFFTEGNSWVVENLARVEESQEAVVTMDAEMVFSGEKLSVNTHIVPLRSAKGIKLGSMLLLDDISSEKRVKSTMARYMDPSLADRLLQRGEEILGGQSSVATVLFSDIRSFTTLTEELGAQGTVALLNEYFTIMVECITSQGGMLDKFIGDAIMAVFGTPLAHDDDPDRAMRAAISMLTGLATYNQQRVARGAKVVKMGIGLNTDTVVSGNIGSPKRMDYTVIGDGVNLAARLESACKQYCAQLLVSEYTMAQVRGTYRARLVDRVVVKGKTAPVEIYEVLDFHDEQSFPNLAECIGRFGDGVRSYRKQAWDRAISSFEKGLKANPSDQLAEIYIARCREMKANPPGEDWDGVWVMTSK